ncbi:MAG: hypothetical protein RL266_890, partial [Bacteroidota bacterium]
MNRFYARIITLSFILSTGGFAFAQNVGVDVALPQQKLDVAGGIRIGTTTNALLGSLRMNGTVLEYHNGTAW